MIILVDECDKVIGTPCLTCDTIIPLTEEEAAELTEGALLCKEWQRQAQRRELQQKRRPPMTITTVPVSGSELHCRYPRQTSSQPCYVELDCERNILRAVVDPEIGGAVPEAVWHGRVLRFAIPALKQEAANKLLAEISVLAERIVAGYEEVWDGHNHVGVLDEDAQDAQDDVNALCEGVVGDDSALLSVWEAADWYGELGNLVRQALEVGVTAETSDERLDEIAEKEEMVAEAEGVLVEDIREHLDKMRETCREAKNEE